MSGISLSRSESPTSAWKPRVPTNVLFKTFGRRLRSKTFLICLQYHQALRSPRFLYLFSRVLKPQIICLLGGGIERRPFKYEHRCYLWGSSRSRGIMEYVPLVFDAPTGFRICRRAQGSPASFQFTHTFFHTLICEPCIINP